MYACDIGLEMYYDAGGSGSGIAQAKRFLLENMRYSNDMKIVWPYNYSSKEWRALIYGELSQNRPVYMEGGGHAFVCDGYSDSGYFHFNWGWGGEMDGYFLLNDLTPYDSNYWNDLNALINITERETGKAQFTYDLYNSGGIFFDNNAIYSDYVWNPSRYKYYSSIGMEAVDMSNGKSTYLNLGVSEIEGATPSGTGVFRECKCWNMPTDGIDLPTGIYNLYPVYERTPKEYSRLPILAGAQEFVELSVDEDGKHTYTNPKPSFTPDIEISDITFVNGESTSPRESNAANTYEFAISYLLHNHSDYPIPAPTVIVNNEFGKEIINDGLSFIPYEPNKTSMASFGKARCICGRANIR